MSDSEKRQKELRGLLDKLDAQSRQLDAKRQETEARAAASRAEVEGAVSALAEDLGALDKLAPARRRLSEAEALLTDLSAALAQSAEQKAGIERELERLQAEALAAQHGLVVEGLRQRSAALKARAVGHLRGLFATLEERGEIQLQASSCYAAREPLELLTEDELAHALADLFGNKELAFRALHNFIMAHATGGTGHYTDADAHLARYGLTRFAAGVNVVPLIGPTLIQAVV